MRFVQATAGLGVLLALSLLGGPVAARAQERVETPEGRVPRTFGTTVETSYTISPWAFTGFRPGDSAALNSVSVGTRYCSSDCFLLAAASLPAGAVVTAIQLEACDTDSVGNVEASLLRNNQDTGTVLLAKVDTVGATPGCVVIGMAPSSVETIDNVHNTYTVSVQLTGGTNATRFRAVRLFYQLQVSPAPATATFNDVPASHQFFRFIEALAAAGITGGCSASPPLYCPDNPLTRGQMAVFLARALGLQFAP
jgi:hypothetical protein